jgi:hypothetical protein
MPVAPLAAVARSLAAGSLFGHFAAAFIPLRPIREQDSMSLAELGLWMSSTRLSSNAVLEILFLEVGGRFSLQLKSLPRTKG